MVQKMKLVQNDVISIVYSFTQQGVLLSHMKDGRIKMFGGWADLENIYDEFGDALTDQTTFEDAVKYFTPNIGSTILNQ